MNDIMRFMSVALVLVASSVQAAESPLQRDSGFQYRIDHKNHRVEYWLPIDVRYFLYHGNDFWLLQVSTSYDSSLLDKAQQRFASRFPGYQIVMGPKRFYTSVDSDVAGVRESLEQLRVVYNGVSSTTIPLSKDQYLGLKRRLEAHDFPRADIQFKFSDQVRRVRKDIHVELSQVCEKITSDGLMNGSSIVRSLSLLRSSYAKQISFAPSISSVLAAAAESCFKVEVPTLVNGRSFKLNGLLAKALRPQPKSIEISSDGREEVVEKETEGSAIVNATYEGDFES